MPWWSWVVIWAVLVLGLLGMLGYLGYRLFVKFLAVLEALGELGDKLELLEEHGEALADPPFRSAVFEDASVPAARWHERRRAARERRQLRREQRVAQGRLLTKTDYRRYSHLLKRT